MRVLAAIALVALMTLVAWLLNVDLTVAVLLLLVTVIVAGAGYYFRGTTRDETVAVNPVPSSAKETVKPLDLPKAAASFPRRFLAVCVHNYLYANPVNYGSKAGNRDRTMHSAVERIANYFHVDRSQAALLSDGAPAATARPPLKAVTWISKGAANLRGRSMSHSARPVNGCWPARASGRVVP